jgi:hypothetical protein
LEALRARPAAVHLATHYLESAGRTGYGLIALSLSPDADSQVLTPFEISRWHIQAGVVVLSGCHSAAGKALPGEGALGLPRAWLAAGAESVVGSLWDTPDDDGALFGVFYRNLRGSERLDAARALRVAQLTMFKSGGRFSSPAYWGAYFAIANRGKGGITPMNPTPARECASEKTAEPRWANVVDRIRQGDPKGMEELYEVFSKGVRFFLYRQLGPRDLDDKSTTCL